MQPGPNAWNAPISARRPSMEITRRAVVPKRWLGHATTTRFASRQNDGPAPAWGGRAVGLLRAQMMSPNAMSVTPTSWITLVMPLASPSKAR